MPNLTDTGQQPQITWGLIIGILDLLEANGFHKSPRDGDVGRAIGMIGPLTRAYTGNSDDA